ncbi:ATP-dependent Clp protease adapter ClpS [Desulfatibacillum aliphaticivorans]|uniref:ATP-dependent Clp protease adapter protein ClpS n=2 Tax=Desulfatibacillum TaxID=218207 RepID=CLPS_DESAL|nr:ATP-dependent Clp protease adapter ClpS [Desulfatibacillum aliphaticivorans]B8FGA3.1 RecName: Full=ATP-dependent Clp protease adapter protein ClpS [Desulfatibacillum aliphaticivorans]ACL03783.1 ATP-dependent Clp protease adaptor protein ClpS [Desulfatibacillum aliphaticivorans]
MSPDPHEDLGDVLTEPTQKTERPRMFKVLLHNDDYTTMEFVVGVLQRVFNKSVPEATRIMLNVHNRGVGVAGVYTAEVAETKIETVHSMAQADGFPLKCSMEPE